MSEIQEESARGRKNLDPEERASSSSVPTDPPPGGRNKPDPKERASSSSVPTDPPPTGRNNSDQKERASSSSVPMDLPTGGRNNPDQKERASSSSVPTDPPTAGLNNPDPKERASSSSVPTDLPTGDRNNPDQKERASSSSVPTDPPTGGRNNPDQKERASSSFVLITHPPPAGRYTRKFIEDVVAITVSTRKIRDRVQKLRDLQSLNNYYFGMTGASAMEVTINRVRVAVTCIYLDTGRLNRRVEELDRSNAAGRDIMNCGEGSSTDRLRMCATLNFKRELRETAADIQALITDTAPRLRTVTASYTRLQQAHEFYVNMGTDAEPPQPERDSQEFIQDYIEEKVSKIVDGENAKKDPSQRDGTDRPILRNRMNAMVTGCCGKPSTS